MLQLNCDRPKLEFLLPDGEKRVWEYDVVTIKLITERLEDSHKLVDVNGKLKRPTTEFLVDFCQALREENIPHVNVDLALRIYSLIKVQFAQLSRSIADTLDA